jgi:NDP-hexose-3-ketoreductase
MSVTVIEKRKAAVWGWGAHAKRYVVPAILRSASFELTEIISRGCANPEIREIDNRAVVFSNEQQVLSNPELDTVFVTTPTGLHYEHCLRALNANKNVICEKSLTTSLDQSLQLISLARRKGLFLAEAFMYLFHPQYLELKRLVSSGQLGRLSSIICEFGVPLLDRSGFRRTAELGGGAFWDVACYTISVLIQLCDQTPEVLKAYVETPAGREGATDEGGCAFLRLRPETYAFLTWGYGRAYRNRLTIWGDTGSLVIDRVFSKTEDYDSCIETYDQFGKRAEIATGKASSFVNMLNTLGNRMDRTDCRAAFCDAAERQAISMHRVLQHMTSAGAA